MKLQDRFKYDPTLLGLQGKYEILSNADFLIDMNCVQVKNSIVQIGETYFFFERKPTKEIKATFVKLVDVFYLNDYLYLLIIDLFSGQARLLNHVLDNGLVICRWKLVDTFSMEKMIDEKHHN